MVYTFFYLSWYKNNAIKWFNQTDNFYLCIDKIYNYDTTTIGVYRCG